MTTPRTDETGLRLPRLQAVTLARFVLGFVALAAAAGWAASFVGLHGFALTEMHGYSALTAWLVPGSFDGAAFACSVLVYRASIFGRSALRGRVLMYGFTLLSGWINWHFQTNPLGQWVAAALPFAAVLVFDTVLSDLRAEWETKHGQQAFRLRLGLLGLRWLVDRPGTGAAFRATITAVPVTDLVGLGAMSPVPVPPGTGSVPGPPSASHGGNGTGTQTVAPGPYAGPVPAFSTGTETVTVDVVDGTGTVRHRHSVPWHEGPGHVDDEALSGTEDLAPVPVVTQPRPAPRNAGTGTGPMTEARPVAPPRPGPAPAQRYPESASEQTMIIPRIRPDGEQRSKVTSPQASSRRLVSVPATNLDKTATDTELAAFVATEDHMSRRAVMARFGVGSGRATKIIALAREVSTDGQEASTR